MNDNRRSKENELDSAWEGSRWEWGDLPDRDSDSELRQEGEWDLDVQEAREVAELS